MVKIRLKRMGSKFNAYYRIIVADQRSPRDGRFIEEIGTYNPHTKNVTIDEEIKEKWLKNGAIPTETMKNLFKKYEIAKKNGNIKENIVTLIKKPKKRKTKKEINVNNKNIKEKI